MTDFDKPNVVDTQKSITEKESVFNVLEQNKWIKQQWDLDFDIPKFEETMTLLLDKYNLSKEVAKPVAETIAKVKFLEDYKTSWKLAWDTTYKVANNIIPSNLDELAA